MRARVVAAAALWLLVAGAGCHKKKSFRVAAAADLQLAFQEVAVAFKAQGGAAPSFTFGSSGLLAKQVAEGAPFDLFASGNTSYVDQVVAAGACDAATRSAYARGRLVAWTPPGGPAPPTTLADLADVRFKRIAIANPEHAPYGKAAKQALTASEIAKGAKTVGKVLKPVGIASDAAQLKDAFEKDGGKVGRETAKAGLEIGGGWGGAIGGAKLGALGGAAIGSAIPIVGTAIGGVVGGIAGGVIGGLTGGAFGKWVGSWF